MTRKEPVQRGRAGRKGKGRGESKPIRWAASYDMTTAVCVSVGGLGEDNGECCSHEGIEETQLERL